MSNDYNEEVGEVICRQYGDRIVDSIFEINPKNSDDNWKKYGRSIKDFTKVIWINSIECSGYESSIWDCIYENATGYTLFDEEKHSIQIYQKNSIIFLNDK